MWIAEGRLAVFNVAIEHVTALASPPFSVVERFADLILLESRVNRDANQVPIAFKIVLGQDGIHYGSFGPLS